MKTILLSLILFSSFVFGQSSLEIKKKSLENKLIKIQDSIKIINEEIIKFKATQAINDTKSVNIRAVILKNAKIREEPIAVADEILILDKDQDFFIKDFYDNYFYICNESICGYVNEMNVIVNPDVQKLLTDKKNIELQNKLRIDKEIANNKLKDKDRLIKKIGKEKYDLLMLGRYWIGMTSEMALISFGSPDKINTTDAYWGNSEQWVYPNKFLYFDNGILTAIQH